MALEAAEPDDFARVHLGVEGLRSFPEHDALDGDCERGVGLMHPGVRPAGG